MPLHPRHSNCDGIAVEYPIYAAGAAVGQDTRTASLEGVGLLRHSCSATEVEMSESISDFKAIPPHTLLILHHQTLTFLLRIIAPGEEHAFVAGGFFGDAHAAWLGSVSVNLHWGGDVNDGDERGGSLKEELTDLDFLAFFRGCLDA